LFADLAATQLRAIAHRFDEAYFTEGEHVLRRGLAGGGFYLIVEGKASVRVDGTEQAVLVPGDFVGEISILLDETPSADVVAATELRCLVLPPGELAEVLMAHPRLLYRMLQAEARKLRNTTRWRS
jgi:CRP-like cAMP-binding protein